MTECAGFYEAVEIIKESEECNYEEDLWCRG